jgi:DNA-binding NarL/FixJ family response regulator
MKTNASADAAKPPLKVFLVEDSPLVRDRLVEMLDEIGGQVKVAGHSGSARDAVRAILQARPDVVLCDLQLPDGTGYNVLRDLHRAAPEIGVYMVSNFSAQPYREHAAQLGARDFFDKSTELQCLRNALAGLAAARH